MRIVPTRATRSNRPFQGQGASLYVGGGNPDPGAGAIVFRNLRAWPVRGQFTAGGASKIGGTNTLKTARVASVADPTAAFAYTVPGSYAGKTFYAQVRTFKDDVENETSIAPARLVLDGSLNNAAPVTGRARLLRTEIRDGGIVRIRFQFFPDPTGQQPLLFRIQRTAGPTSPADVTLTYFPGNTVYEIDTPALSDSAPYTYKLRAENGATTLDLVTGIVFTADATGPVAPTAPTALPF
jgi:hypothetical protein